MSKTSDNYEKFVQKVVQALASVDVHRHQAYEGRVTRRKIIVDLSFTMEVAGGAKLLFVVECKCYNHSVPVDDVEEFFAKCNDIGVHKGIMVTTKGYQDGAIKVAIGRGIALALLTKKKQSGELSYVTNATGEVIRSDPNGFWQGNVLGVRDITTGGLRFDDMESFLYFLIRDFIWERERFAHQDIPWRRIGG